MMKNFGEDPRWDNFTFAQINQLKAFPEETLDVFLNLDANLYTSDDIKKIKIFLNDYVKKEKADKTFLTKTLSFLNTNKNKVFLNSLYSFTSQNPDYKTSFLKDTFVNFLGNKIKSGDSKLLEIIDYSKLHSKNYHNFVGISYETVEKFNNLECLYKLYPIQSDSFKTMKELLDLYPDKDISDIIIPTFAHESPYNFKDILDKLVYLTKINN